MELVLITLRRGASFEVGYVRAFVAYYKCTLKLTCVACVDAEVGRQLHGTARVLGYVHERAVAEHRAVEGCKIVVAVGDDAAKVLFDQIGVFPYGLADGAEDDALLRQLLLECRLHRHRIHDGVHGCARESESLFERYAQFVKSLHQFWVNLLKAVRSFLCFGCRVGIV